MANKPFWSFSTLLPQVAYGLYQTMKPIDWRQKHHFLPHWLFLESRDKNDAILQVNNEPLRTNLCSMQRQKVKLYHKHWAVLEVVQKPLRDMLIFQCVTFTLSKNSHYENDYPMHPVGRALTSNGFINLFVMVSIRKKISCNLDRKFWLNFKKFSYTQQL